MKKILIAVLCVILAVALMGCSSSPKTLEEITSQEVLDEVQSALDDFAGDSGTMIVSIEDNTIKYDVYFSEDSGVVADEADMSYFESSAFDDMMQSVAQKSVSQMAQDEDFKSAGIETVTFQVNYYDIEGTLMFSNDYTVDATNL